MSQSKLSRFFSRYLLPFVAATALVGSTTMPAHAQAIRNSVKPQNTIFNYPDFSDITGLTLNGSAVVSGDFLEVGVPAFYNVGSTFYTNQVNVAQGFTTAFTLSMAPDGSYTSADGMAFVIQNSSVNALGNDDGQPGYEGIVNSLAVEFDTFRNEHLGDPNDNHVGVQSCGTAANSLSHNSNCNLGLQATLPVKLAGGKPFHVVISYAPANSGSELSIWINTQLVLTSHVPLSTLLQLNGNDAWVGFTAGSGSAYEQGFVRDWIFSSSGTAE